MPGVPNPPQIRELQREIETFIRARAHPLVVEGDSELFDLTAASWRLTVQFDKLLLEVWNPARSIVRRIDEIAYRDREALGLFVHKPGGRSTTTLEIRELKTAARPAPDEARPSYRRHLLAMLKQEYPGWKFERVSHRSDREHSFSTHYTRGLARRGTTAWAFLGLSPEEPPGASDGLLGQGIIWLDWLRSRAERFTVGVLKLFVPRASVESVAHRAAYLHPGAVQIEILEWKPGDSKPNPIDLGDYGNVATRLAPRRQAEELLLRHTPLIRELLGEYEPNVDVVPGPGSNNLSLRVLGLEVGRIEGLLAPHLWFGLEGSFRRFNREERREFQDFLSRVVEIRRADSRDPAHEFYRLQSERWLESLLVRDIRCVDPTLLAKFVYPQVPAFTGQDRGVIDILTVTRRGRLAVVELKLDEDINLPLQGLDYWLRVRWLQEGGRFQEFGYFPGVELSPEPPLLYLVSPAFRFHSTSDRVIRYLAPSIEVIKVGVNQQWRRRVEVLFRRSRRGA